MNQIKVLIVDDEPLIRHALGTILSTDERILLVNSLNNGKDALEFCEKNEIDVVIMDLQMPVMDGVTATELIKKLPHSPAVLAITAFSADDYLVPVLLAGASGYLVKDSEPDEIVDAVISVHQGTAAISPSVSNDLIGAVKQAYNPVSQREPLAKELALTARELEILDLLAEGLNNPEISRKLGVAETTIKTHMAKIFVKLDVRDRVQVLVEAARIGLINLNR